MNRQILLAARPVGFPKDSDFTLVEAPAPTPGDGQILVRSIYLSVDPYMRGRMNDVKSYAPPVQIGGVMGGGAVAKVVGTNMAEWLTQGKLKYKEDIEHGIENTPRAFIAMLKGRNVGKQLVKVSEP